MARLTQHQPPALGDPVGVTPGRRRLLAAAALSPLRGVAASRWPYPTLDGKAPIVIAHRGSPAMRPEHTIEGYRLAIAQGADFIEPDVVITRDGVLVVRHDNELSLTTDVARRAEFAARRRKQVVDGKTLDGWFVEDFTLAELKRLRAIERWPALRRESARFDGQFEVPTLDEVLALRRDAERSTGRRIGIYPETKHAAHFAARGLALEERLVDALHADELRGAGAPVFIQSFEATSLQALAPLTELPRVQLLGAGDVVDLARLRTYAQAIGVAKALVIPRTAEDTLGTATELVQDAHAAGLAVHAWTFRREAPFLPRELVGRPEIELERFLATGLDGVFTDHSDLALQVRHRLARE
jgi:glycerophosphoryl diester phosphodiesterase